MKVAMYVRVSTQRQALTQTIEQQIHVLSEYSLAHAWPWQEECFRDRMLFAGHFNMHWNPDILKRLSALPMCAR